MVKTYGVRGFGTGAGGSQRGGCWLDRTAGGGDGGCPSTAAQSCGGGCGGGGLLGTTPGSRLGLGCECWMGTRERGGMGHVMGKGQGGRMGWGFGTGRLAGTGGGGQSTAAQDCGMGSGGGGCLNGQPADVRIVGRREEGGVVGGLGEVRGRTEVVGDGVGVRGVIVGG